MNFLNRAERKYGKYAIKNLSLYIIIGYVIGYALEYLLPTVYSYITLDPYLIIHGQIWRIVTWILSPPSSLSIFTIIMLFFYYSIGTSLERTWGAFRYNVYILSGVVFTVIGAFVIYFILKLTTAGQFGLDPSDSAMCEYLGTYISSMFSTYYINMSIFLAFAASYPDMQVLLYFIIPIKVKWIALLDVVLLVYDFVVSGWPLRTAIIASLLNFIVFFLTTRDFAKNSPKNVKRRRDYKKKVVNSKTIYSNGARHKCAICGRTELDGDDLVFRYCSKCAGNYEYCQDHIFTHEHKKA